MCPKLSVNCWFESIGTSADMIHVLVPEMPVNEVHIDTRFDHNADWLHLNETIDHITCHHKKISKYLFIICLFVYLFVSAADPDIPFKGRA